MLSQNIQDDFSCNDYLGLANDPLVKQAFVRGCKLYSIGSTGSAVISGYHPIHRQFERTLATAFNAEDALLFSSAYAANLALIALLAALQTTVLIDKSVHASVYDGIAKQSKLTIKRFKHNDLQQLAALLANKPNNPIVLTEGLFGMSGQYAQLDIINELCHTHTALLMVDEAHAFGVMGQQGLGAVNHYQLTVQEVPLRVIGFGKAMGAQGGAIVGAGHWIELLLQYARSYIYSTAPSPAWTYGLLYAFERLRAADDRRIQLQEVLTYF